MIQVFRQMDGRYYLHFGAYSASGMTMSEALRELADRMEVTHASDAS